MLVNKEWADMNLYGLGLQDSTLNFKNREVYIDTIKAEWVRMHNGKDTLLSYAFDYFKFDSNGNVTYDWDLKSYGLCGNGLIYFDRAEWALTGENIMLDMEGDISMVGKFHYRNEYKIIFPDRNTLQLKLIKVLESKFEKRR